MVEEIRVETLGDLVDQATPSEPDLQSGRRRYTGVYHGSVDAGTRLLTSLDRLSGVAPRCVTHVTETDIAPQAAHVSSAEGLAHHLGQAGGLGQRPGLLGDGLEQRLLVHFLEGVAVDVRRGKRAREGDHRGVRGVRLRDGRLIDESER